MDNKNDAIKWIDPTIVIITFVNEEDPYASGKPSDCGIIPSYQVACDKHVCC